MADFREWAEPNKGWLLFFSLESQKLRIQSTNLKQLMSLLNNFQYTLTNCILLKCTRLNKCKEKNIFLSAQQLKIDNIQIFITQLKRKSQMSGKIVPILQGYLRQDNRITLKLNILVQLLKVTKHPLKEVKKQIKSTSKPLKLFRALILIHECYLNNFLDCSQATELLSLIKNSVKPKQNVELDQVISKKVISQYCLYLQKCFLFKQELSEVSDFNFQTNELLYMYINLLKTGLSFVDILYMFGRYYRTPYLFIIDFNVIIGKDFLELYNGIKKILIVHRNLWNEQMKQQLQNMHQKMYIVYYNCYFYKHLIGIVPKWIDTEPISPGINKNRSRSTKKQYIFPLKASTNLQSSYIQSSPTKKILSLFSTAGSTIGSIENKSLIIDSTSKHKQSQLKSKDMNKSEIFISQFTTEVNCQQIEVVIDEVDDVESENQPCELIQDMRKVIDLINKKELRKQPNLFVTNKL